MATFLTRNNKFILETKTITHEVTDALKIFSLDLNNKDNMLRWQSRRCNRNTGRSGTGGSMMVDPSGAPVYNRTEVYIVN